MNTQTREKNNNQMTSLNIGIVGYGRMGQEIEAQAIQRNHTIAFIVDPNIKSKKSNSSDTHIVSQLSELGERIQIADIIIEFSLPHAVLENISHYARQGISAIIGTTGWEKEKARIQDIVEANNVSVVYGGNFSIGAHIFMKISTYAAQLLNLIPEYDVSLWESHHNKKIDRPSGTALMTAERMVKALDRKTTISSDIPHGEAINSEILSVVSQRVGHEMGFHEVIADSPFDTIKITHHARTRSGFALGSILAAEWTKNSPKKGLITVNEFIDALLKD